MYPMDCCSDVFTDYISRCNGEIQFYAQLQPITNYRWVITDKFDQKYSGPFSTDAQGFWVIDIDDILPVGLISQFGGKFKLEVFLDDEEGSENCTPVKMKIARMYSAIELQVKGGSHVKDQIGCQYECPVEP